MPLQNRVNPWGAIEAVAARGTMMGNRGGKFHKPDKTLGARRWASRHWICCDLYWKGAHHEPMGQGYTSLFFLDEVTALSAGHRPCFYCRRKVAKAFLGETKVKDFDARLHAERLIPPQFGEISGLPSGAMVEIDTFAFAIKDQSLLRWTYDGYADRIPCTPHMRGKVLTPAAILSILHAGYAPRWHESAY
jgi:hypothetical protein